MWHWFPCLNPRWNFVLIYYPGQRWFNSRSFYLTFHTMMAPTMRAKGPTWSVCQLSSMSTPIIYSDIRGGKSQNNYNRFTVNWTMAKTLCCLVPVCSILIKIPWQLLFKFSKYAPFSSTQLVTDVNHCRFLCGRTWRFITMYACHGIAESFSWGFSFFFNK